MYRSDLNTRDKGGAFAAVVLVHAAVLVALLTISGKVPISSVQSALKVFNLEVPPPPPPQPPPSQQRQQVKPKQKEGSSAPQNIKSEATPVKQPPQRVELPVRPTITTSPTPRTGTMPTQGASVVGPGTGAGGVGNGTGSGAGGSGYGAGGDNGVAEPPHLVTPVLSGSDFPSPMLYQWPNNATVFLRLRVDQSGYISECVVDRGTGVASIDSAICDLARTRLRFRPAMNRSGQAVAGWFGYAQPAPG